MDEGIDFIVVVDIVVAVEDSNGFVVESDDMVVVTNGTNVVLIFVVETFELAKIVLDICELVVEEACVSEDGVIVGVMYVFVGTNEGYNRTNVVVGRGVCDEWDVWDV